MRLDCEYVNAKKNCQYFFDNSKYVFWVEGAYAAGSRIEFPVNNVFINLDTLSTIKDAQISKYAQHLRRIPDYLSV
jgi:hypothetical protein